LMQSPGQLSQCVLRLLRKGELSRLESDLGKLFALGAHEVSQGGKRRARHVPDDREKSVRAHGGDVELGIVELTGQRQLNGDLSVSIPQEGQCQIQGQFWRILALDPVAQVK